MEFDAKKAILLLILANVLYGFIGLFSRHFSEMGCSSFDITFIRMSVTFLVIAVVMFLTDRKAFRASPKDILMFLCFSVFKFLADVMYFFALNNTPIALASVLQMTFPYYVLILSFLLFRERIDAKKIVATLVASTGCVLLTGNILTGGDIVPEGVFAALLSGICLAVYILGGTACFKREIKPSKYLLYCSFFGTLLTLPFINIDIFVTAVWDVQEIPFILGLGVLVSSIPIFIEVWSARYLMPSTISIVAMLDLMTSVLVGAMFFDEILSPQDILGVVLVIASIIIINVRIGRGLRRYVKENPEVMEEFKRIVQNMR